MRETWHELRHVWDGDCVWREMPYDSGRELVGQAKTLDEARAMSDTRSWVLALETERHVAMHIDGQWHLRRRGVSQWLICANLEAMAGIVAADL